MHITSTGFVDLQVNGFAGVDFNTPGLPPEALPRALAAMRATGVTRCLPTLITSSLERFAACAAAIVACPDPAIAGIHMEGPYLSPFDGPRGAHPANDVIAASVDDFRRRQDVAGGRIRLVTLAPEVPNAIGLIEYLVREGVRVAIGHTAATSAQIGDAVSAGASLSTHLGNGCAAMQHRHDNVIWAQAAADSLRATFIADGHHLPASVLKSLMRAKHPMRSILVSDATAAAAAPVGRYYLGDLEVERDSAGRVGLPGTTYLAGSALTMEVAIGETVRATGLGVEDVLAMANAQPAAYLGMETAGTVHADWDALLCVLTIVNVADR